MLKYRWKKRKQSQTVPIQYERIPKAVCTLRDEIETQMLEDSYLNGESDGTIEDYLELVELFGFISLFAVALPISSLSPFQATQPSQVDLKKAMYSNGPNEFTN